jgi:hypothetical protein
MNGSDENCDAVPVGFVMAGRGFILGGLGSWEKKHGDQADAVRVMRGLSGETWSWRPGASFATADRNISN